MTSLVLKMNPIPHFYLKRLGCNENLELGRTWPYDFVLASLFQPQIKYFNLSDQSEKVTRSWFGVNLNPPYGFFMGPQSAG